MQLLALFGVALLLCLLAIRWAVRPGMRVLAELFGALVRIAAGRLDTRLPPHRFAEARELAERFNHMAAALEDTRADNDRLTQALLALQERERTVWRRPCMTTWDSTAGIRAGPACCGSERSSRMPCVKPRPISNSTARICRTVSAPWCATSTGDARSPRTADAIGQLAEQWQSTQGIECELQLQVRCHRCRWRPSCTCTAWCRRH